MKTELENKIYTDFPEFFNSVKSEPIESCHTPQYLFGIECDSGWYQLLYDLFTELNNNVKQLQSETSYTVVYPQMMQIKEKFGGLRFYVDSATDEQYKIISKYEHLSYHICEICGKKGKLRNVFGWYITLCKSHLIQYLIGHYRDYTYYDYITYTCKRKIKNFIYYRMHILHNWNLLKKKLNLIYQWGVSKGKISCV